MRLEIQAVDGHFVLFGAAVYAAGGYGEAERLGLFLAGREEIFFSEEGAEGGDTNSPPVGDAAGEGDVGGFSGADRSTEGNEMFDYVAVGAHAHLVAAVRWRWWWLRIFLLRRERGRSQ